MVYNRHESNLVTVDKIMVLMEEVAIFKSRFQEHDTGNLRTTVNVFENRIQELREIVHD